MNSREKPIILSGKTSNDLCSVIEIKIYIKHSNSYLVFTINGAAVVKQSQQGRTNKK